MFEKHIEDIRLINELLSCKMQQDRTVLTGLEPLQVRSIHAVNELLGESVRILEGL